MCDENTERELEAFLERKKLSRRGFAKGVSGAVAASSVLSAGFAHAAYDSGKLTETDVSIVTPDGMADAKFIHPREGAHAAVIFWPDIHGVRPAHFEMARRLASAGYSVLAANPYYRTHQGQLFYNGETIFSEGGFAKVRPHREVFSGDTVAIDAKALTAWLDKQPAVDTSRGVGAVGFCMTGSWTLRSAAAVPDRISAPCSFHGGGLVTDGEDSPHLLAPMIKGGALIAIAENDHERAPDHKDVLISAFKDAGVPAEIEVYEDAMHGWVPTDSRAYDQEQSERAWGRMLALFEQQLSA